MLKRYHDPSPYFPEKTKRPRTWYIWVQEGSVALAGILIGIAIGLWIIL